MASRTLLPLLLLLLPFLFIATAATADTAQGPTPPPEANLTSILAKGEQYTTLLRLLNSTGQNEQLAAQLKNSYNNGLTFFVPTDAAFAKLSAVAGGALNALTDQQQVQLVLYHVLPRYYSLAAFQTASNPLSTEASGPSGVYGVNVTTSTENSLVNVSTGVVDDVPLGSTLFAEFPLAVYSVDDVLLPAQMFGKARAGIASAPAPAQQAGRKKGGTAAVPKSDVAAGPWAAGAEEDDGAESANAAAGWGKNVGRWSSFAAGLALMAVASI